LALECLGAGELHDYVRHEAGRLRIGAVRQTVLVLRTFTRFLFATDVTASDLTGCVPSVSGTRFDAPEGSGRGAGSGAAFELCA
ncbi:MAG: hypothetical protein LC790_01525, partial [Actinobacteria bacterium]|nr:hypothetical protein [Actinomycetota bacterium]